MDQPGDHGAMTVGGELLPGEDGGGFLIQNRRGLLIEDNGGSAIEDRRGLLIQNRRRLLIEDNGGSGIDDRRGLLIQNRRRLLIEDRRGFLVHVGHFLAARN